MSRFDTSMHSLISYRVTFFILGIFLQECGEKSRFVALNPGFLNKTTGMIGLSIWGYSANVHNNDFMNPDNSQTVP